MNKEIFTYWNGTRDVKCDPMMIEANFNLACASVDIDEIMSKFIGPEWLGDPEKSASFDDSVVKLAVHRRQEAITQLIPVLCKTFNVKHLHEDEDNGMTASEILDAFTAWQNYTLDVKKNTDSRPNSPPNTDLPSQQTIMKDNLDITTTPKGPSGSAHSRSRKG